MNNKNQNQSKMIRQQQRKQLVQENIIKTTVEEKFNNIEKYDLLNLSCSIKKILMILSSI